MIDKAYDRRPTLRSRALRNNPTLAEKNLWIVLRNRQLDGVRFNRQVPIGLYICDFVARTPRLIVELDGGHHGVEQSCDAARTRFLVGQGYRLMRFWNNDVMENIEGVVLAIRQELGDTPSPSPSRSAGGGI